MTWPDCRCRRRRAACCSSRRTACRPCRPRRGSRRVIVLALLDLRTRALDQHGRAAACRRAWASSEKSSPVTVLPLATTLGRPRRRRLGLALRAGQRRRGLAQVRSITTSSGSVALMPSWVLPLWPTSWDAGSGDGDPRADRGPGDRVGEDRAQLTVERQHLGTALVVGAVGLLLALAVADPDLGRDLVALVDDDAGPLGQGGGLDLRRRHRRPSTRPGASDRPDPVIATAVERTAARRGGRAGRRLPHAARPISRTGSSRST